MTPRIAFTVIVVMLLFALLGSCSQPAVSAVASKAQPTSTTQPSESVSVGETSDGGFAEPMEAVSVGNGDSGTLPETGTEKPVTPSQKNGGRPLLPGLLGIRNVNEVRIWRIGEEGITYTYNPKEAEPLLAVIQEENGKKLEGELESPTHIIQIRSKDGEYNLIIGSNGIMAPEGKLYEVVFPERIAELYLPKSVWNPEDPYIVPPTGKFREGWIRGTDGTVVKLSGDQTKRVHNALDNLKICEDEKPTGNFFVIVTWIGDIGFTYMYYPETDYVVYEVETHVKKTLYSIDSDDAQTLMQIYQEVFGYFD